MTEHVLTTAGGRRMAAVEHPGRPGTGEPVRVLALHGWLDNAGSFARLAPGLDANVVALDLIGHGHSERYPDRGWHHYLDHLSDIHAALDDLGWDRCVIMGHSMGGGLGLVYAATFPERVQGLISIDMLGPVTSDPSEFIKMMRRGILARASSPPAPRNFATLEEAVQARVEKSRLSLDGARALAERGIEKTPEGFRWRADPRHKLPSLYRLNEPQVEKLLAAIACPVLVIEASRSIYPQMKAMFARRAAKLADVQHHELEGDHHLHLDNPGPVAAKINGFLTAIR